MAACGNESTGAPKPYLTEPPMATEVPVTPTEVPATPTPTQVPATPTPEVDWYQAMLDRSVMYRGNNARLKKVIEKARNGETVNIATLGGSITEGANATPWTLGYAYRFAEKFAAEYGVNGGEISAM